MSELVCLPAVANGNTAGGISDKCWLRTACDNNLRCSFCFIGALEALARYEKHPRWRPGEECAQATPLRGEDGATGSWDDSDGQAWAGPRCLELRRGGVVVVLSSKWRDALRRAVLRCALAADGTERPPWVASAACVNMCSVASQLFWNGGSPSRCAGCTSWNPTGTFPAAESTSSSSQESSSAASPLVCCPHALRRLATGRSGNSSPFTFSPARLIICGN